MPCSPPLRSVTLRISVRRMFDEAQESRWRPMHSDTRAQRRTESLGGIDDQYPTGDGVTAAVVHMLVMRLKVTFSVFNRLSVFSHNRLDLDSDLYCGRTASGDRSLPRRDALGRCPEDKIDIPNGRPDPKIHVKVVDDTAQPGRASKRLTRSNQVLDDGYRGERRSAYWTGNGSPPDASDGRTIQGVASAEGVNVPMALACVPSGNCAPFAARGRNRRKAAS